MNCETYTLTNEEFKNLHNALWEIGRSEDSNVQALVEKIRQTALKGAYEQDNKAFETKSAHYERIREELGLQAIWSVYEVKDLSQRHPFEGADRVVYKDHWGEKPVSAAINGLTWAALFVAANACIRDSGDGHHVFIERFTPSKDDPRTLVLQTGS